MKQRSPTLEDVAQASGVSTATISRALNDPDKVAKKTRDRIHKAIDALGYTPNFGGRALATSRVTTVGAVIPTMANAMFASGLQAFQEVLSEAGVTLLIGTSGYDCDEEFRQIKSLVGHGVGGLLLIGTDRSDAARKFLHTRQVPYVLSWCFQNSGKDIFAGFDNKTAASRITRKVLDLGHRDIALIVGKTTGNDRARARLAGMRSAIQEFGQNACVLNVVETDYRLEYGAEACAQIMSDPVKPTAIICGNDVLAAGALTHAKRIGLSLPGDLSVVGFDDIGLASVTTPALTTVRVPQIEMGRAAANLLLGRISGSAAMQSVELGTQIIMRASLVAR